jgi:hypothetical protein
MTAICALRTSAPTVSRSKTTDVAVWYDCPVNEGPSCVLSADDAKGPGGPRGCGAARSVDGAGHMRPPITLLGLWARFTDLARAFDGACG